MLFYRCFTVNSVMCVLGDCWVTSWMTLWVTVEDVSFSVKWLYFFVVNILLALVPSRRRGAGGDGGSKLTQKFF